MVAPRKMLVDPGVGSEAASIGTVAWAQNVRLHMQRRIKDLSSAPDHMQEYVDLVTQHRAWTLMNRPDGSFFATWEEFCEHPQPWGLGKPWAEFRPILEAAKGKKTVQLLTNAPAQSPPGKAKEDSRHDGGLLNGQRSAERIRAIAERAPEQVRQLYREDLIGVAEAAKLGPKNPSPEEAAKVTEVAQAAVAVVKESPKPKTSSEKKSLQQKVNATVREKLGEVVDEAARLLRGITKLDTAARFRLWEAIADKHHDELREVLKQKGYL